MWVEGHRKIWLDLPLMIDAAFCAGAAMITFGAVLGKVSPSQLMYLLVLEVCHIYLCVVHSCTVCTYTLLHNYIPTAYYLHAATP